MLEKQLSQPQLKSLCDVLANSDPNLGLTESEIRLKLGQCYIHIVDKGGCRNEYGYIPGLSKKNWLYNCFANEVNSSKSFRKIYAFIENALDPACYTSNEKRDKYKYLLDETNKILLLVGLEMQETGKIHAVVKAETLDEVDQRVKSLDQKLRDRKIHPEVTKYCIRDYLRKDYHDAVFEAAKGVAQRVRDITGLEKDGGELFQKAFAQKDPYLYFNLLKPRVKLANLKV